MPPARETPRGHTGGIAHRRRCASRSRSCWMLRPWRKTVHGRRCGCKHFPRHRVVGRRPSASPPILFLRCPRRPHLRPCLNCPSPHTSPWQEMQSPCQRRPDRHSMRPPRWCTARRWSVRCRRRCAGLASREWRRNARLTSWPASSFLTCCRRPQSWLRDRSRSLRHGGATAFRRRCHRATTSTTHCDASDHCAASHARPSLYQSLSAKMPRTTTTTFLLFSRLFDAFLPPAAVLVITPPLPPCVV